MSKMTVKSLGQELEIIKEQVKEIQLLKQRVSDLEKTVENLKSQGNEPTKTEDDKPAIKCKKCEQTFTSMKNLKKHMIESHPINLDCKLCDKTFQKNHELETYGEEHQVEKQYKCNVCSKDFYLKWRLVKDINDQSPGSVSTLVISRNVSLSKLVANSTMIVQTNTPSYSMLKL